MPGPQIHPLPASKRSPQDTLQTYIKVLIIIGYQINIKKISELVEIKNDADRLFELKKARDTAATEVRNYGNNARGVERRRPQNEETEARKTRYLLQKYYKNIEAYDVAERLLTAKPTEGTGFQTSRHPYKMTKDGKYGK